MKSQQQPLIRLDVWAASKIQPAPHRAKLASWARNGRIQPQPSKLGKDWYVQADACFVDRNGKRVGAEERPAARALQREPARLLSIDELRQLDSPESPSGLYFLFLAGQLQYVGLSVEMETRIRRHEDELRIKFDESRCLAIEDHRLRVKMEREYIAFYKPRWNVAFADRIPRLSMAPR